MTEPYSPPSFPHQKASTDDGILRHLADRFANLTEAEKAIWRQSDADFLAGCSVMPPPKPMAIFFKCNPEPVTNPQLPSEETPK